MILEYEEIWKLKHLLEHYKIPFTWNKDHFDGCHIMYPQKGETICSVVQFDGSYGGKHNLLEIQGLMTKKEEKETCDTVLGYLTAEDVLKRIRKNYKILQKNKKRELENDKSKSRTN